MRFAPYLFGLGVLAALAPFACSSSPTTVTAVERPQLVAVDPADFMGDVPCEAPRPPPNGGAGGSGGAGGNAGTGGSAGAYVRPWNPAAAHSYVATLFDVTPDIDGGVPNPGVPLASSLPTSCLQKATFSLVVSGHRYLAEIDAYHEDPNDLIPISPGSRLVMDVNNARVVSPWDMAVCGGYPASPPVDDAGADGAAPDGAAGAGGAADDVRPEGVVSYSSITQTPHNCRPALNNQSERNAD